jgi:hypothetical protein
MGAIAGYELLNMVPTVSNGRKAVTISLLKYQTMSEAWALQE